MEFRIMCGIIGYVGQKNATDILLEGLSNLEYRGYDSAGISVCQNDAIMTVKTKGRLQDLVDKMNSENLHPVGHCGIGHTRWATHGKPSQRNSHPHGNAKLSLIHNGIVENYQQIKTFLTEKGYTFTSETDTETAALLMDYHYDGDPFAAIVKTVAEVEGSYAFGVVFADHPDRIYAVRKDSPLIIGLGDGENYIASDVPAILGHTKNYHLLEELEIACIDANEVVVRDMRGNVVKKELLTANWDMDAAQKGGYPHFMLKEIYEQPKALMDTIHPRIKGGLPNFDDDQLPKDFFSRYNRLQFVACGTASFACMVGKSIIEQLARMPVDVDLGSEFRYRDPVFQKDTLVIIISQSGETADTLAALRLAKQSGLDTMAIVNVTGSSIAREADHVLHTYAGPEIAVASTKAFSVQIAMTYLLALAFAHAKPQMAAAATNAKITTLLDVIETTKQVLPLSDALEKMADRYKDTHSLFFIGRGLDHSLAMEGSLKLKEISYIHSESYAAGELKHGTISLITKGVPVVALVTQSALLPKIVSNIKEVQSRGGFLFVITKDGFDIDPGIYDNIIRLPDKEDLFMPLLAVIVLQLFAYHIAVARGCDVDKPRNLAKSVTVE